jgi:photosystem II stability/assembly factor-like uncharacterized protein
VIILISNLSYAQPNWFWQAPIPTGSTLESVKFINQLTGYSCGDVGALIKTTNAGQNWFAITVPKNIDYKGIDNADANILVAVGDSSMIIRTSNGGANWQVITPPSPNHILWSIDFSDANTGYIAGSEGTIWKTTDAGLNWLAQSSPLSILFIVKFYDNNKGVIGGRQAVMLTTNGGTSWVPQSIAFEPFNNVTGVAFADSNTILATAHTENVVFRTSNGGLNWTKHLLDIPIYKGFRDFAADMSFINYNTGFMITSFVGNILKTTNSGINWTQDSSYRIDKWYDVQMLDVNTAYICGTGGTIMNTTNSGVNWNLQIGGLRGINNNYFINASTGFCAADSGIILKTTNAGATWLPKPSGTKLKLNSIHFPNLNTGYCAGDTGIILKTTNCGENWSIQNSETNLKLTSIWFVNTDTGTAVGVEGVAVTTQNGGVDWNAQIIPSGGDLNSVHYAQGRGFTCNTSKIFKTTNSGLNWVQISAGPGGYDIFFTDSLHGCAVGSGITTYRTTNGGANWLSSPSDVNLLLNSVYFVDANNGIAVGERGVMTKTTNGGANWNRLPKATGTWLTSVFFTDGNTGYIAGFYGVILKTTNGGLVFIQQITGTNPESYMLYQNYPNPFNPYTTIKYDLPKAGDVLLRVYDITGREIIKLVNDKQQSGTYELTFDAGSLSSGIYFYSLYIEGKFTAIKKMVLIK